MCRLWSVGSVILIAVFSLSFNWHISLSILVQMQKYVYKMEYWLWLFNFYMIHHTFMSVINLQLWIYQSWFISKGVFLLCIQEFIPYGFFDLAVILSCLQLFPSLLGLQGEKVFILSSHCTILGITDQDLCFIALCKEWHILISCSKFTFTYWVFPFCVTWSLCKTTRDFQ